MTSSAWKPYHLDRPETGRENPLQTCGNLGLHQIPRTVACSGSWISQAIEGRNWVTCSLVLSTTE